VLKGIFLALAISCLGAVTVPAQEERFLGWWEWTITEYRCCPPATPESAGYTEQLLFGLDHRFYRFRDEIIFQSGDWYIEVYEDSGRIYHELITTAGDHWYWGTYVGEPPGLILRDEPFSFDGGGNKTERFVTRGPVDNAATSWGSIKSLFR
jgi:hypothetical protein